MAARVPAYVEAANDAFDDYLGAFILLENMNNEMESLFHRIVPPSFDDLGDAIKLLVLTQEFIHGTVDTTYELCKTITDLVDVMMYVPPTGHVPGHEAHWNLSFFRDFWIAADTIMENLDLLEVKRREFQQELEEAIAADETAIVDVEIFENADDLADEYVEKRTQPLARPDFGSAVPRGVRILRPPRL